MLVAASCRAAELPNKLPGMTKTRLEAFSDGVIAILITIMVLELRAPQGAALSDLREVVPSILMYVLSFVLVGIYWVNHHHMIHATEKVNGAVLWANLHLLFWLSLIPFVTQWMGATTTKPFRRPCTASCLSSRRSRTRSFNKPSYRPTGGIPRSPAPSGSDRKGKISLAIYLVAIPLAFVNPRVSDVLYVIVALVWFIPDRRIERSHRRISDSTALTRTGSTAPLPRNSASCRTSACRRDKYAPTTKPRRGSRTSATTIDPTMVTGDTVVSPMRSGTMIGDDQGNQDSVTASLLFGLTRIGLTMSHVLMSRINTGAAACCASCSLFTIEPTAA